jgi:hypothetical protein
VLARFILEGFLVMRFVVSHPCAKRLRMDGAPLIMHAWVSKRDLAHQACAVSLTGKGRLSRSEQIAA